MVKQLPVESIVLETDAPDLSPEWLLQKANSPTELPAIGRAVAQLKGLSEEAFRRHCWNNTLEALPRLG